MVTALVLPEPEEPELELPEVVEPEEFDPELPELVEPELVAPEVVEPVDPELVEAEEPVGDAVVELELWARAGSCPETSWTKITPQIKANVEAAIATVRLRIKPMRRRRAFSRAVTPPETMGCRSSARWDVVVEVSRGVMVEKGRGRMSEGRVTGVRNSYER